MADSHAIAKYARTYIRRYTHTHTILETKNKVEKVGGKKETKGRGDQGRGKKHRKGPKEKEGKKWNKREKGGGRKEEKKEERRWVQGGRGAWELRKVGPHTNMARSK